MKNFGLLLREIFTVIVGILIAVLINNWNENRKDQKYLDKIFVSIEQELYESKAHLEKVIPKQQALVDTINQFVKDENTTIIQMIMKAGGMQKAEIKTNAWRAIASSKIDLVDYAKIAALSDIENRRENLDQRIEKTLEFAFQNIEETDKAKKELFKMMLVDAINAEQRAYEAIKAFLDGSK